MNTVFQFPHIQIKQEIIWKLFNSLPLGISIATDKSCTVICHNLLAANFLRIGLFYHNSLTSYKAEVLCNGCKLESQEMPIQRAVRNNEIIVNEELEFIWNDGISKTARLNAFPLYDENGEINGAITIYEDITANKKKTKRKSYLVNLEKNSFGMAAVIKAILQSINVGVAVLDHNLKFIMVNDYFAINIHNMAINDIMGHTLQDIFSKKYDPLIVNELLQIHLNTLQTGNPFSVTRWHKRLTDDRYFNWQISQVTDTVDNFAGILMIINDVTEHIQFSSLTRNHSVKFKRGRRDIWEIIENMPDGCYFLDNEWRFSYVNKVAMTYAEDYKSLRQKEDLIGKYVWDILPKTPVFYESMVKAKSTRTPMHIEFFSQLSQYWMSMSIYPQSGGGLAVYFRNIDEQKKIQEKMARLDRLSLVGEMAASISHEIRNPMTTVRGYLQLLESKQQFHDYREKFALMIEELDRANQIISEFLSLANNKLVQRKPVNLVEILKAILPLIECDAHLIGQKVKIELQEIPLAMLDVKEIRQLILNLVRNAFEAMYPGGTLTIQIFSKRNRIVLAVQDEGKGIPEEVKAKIGTPFYTTKENGTGLGLAICYSIAKRHDALIEFTTSKEGTIFYVYFKACES
ncbi:pas fold-4 [Lucifera butyrica]|uniref:histidine kinase n=1 Tax=Lucifera butyrica TaxID=1351585 RepID=A0A498RAU2_9FIRM|nr:PAS domain-containing sensor histidine kinase [Lucifera butyrica]VBB07243.1 pas fold-4 [Lucifera butyrica]